MSEEGKPLETDLEIPAPKVEAKLTFTKEDVVKIKHAREEKRLLDAAKKLESGIKVLKTAGTDIKKKLQEVLEADRDSIPSDLVRLTEALRELGAVRVVSETSRCLRDVDERGGIELGDGTRMVTGVAVHETVDLSYEMKDDRHMVRVYCRNSFRRPNETEAPLIADLDENSKSLEAREEELFGVKKAIGNLPVFLRQLEAAMAQYVLKSTDAGRTLMEAIEDVEIMMLPKALEAPEGS